MLSDIFKDKTEHVTEFYVAPRSLADERGGVIRFALASTCFGDITDKEQILELPVGLAKKFTIALQARIGEALAVSVPVE